MSVHHIGFDPEPANRPEQDTREARAIMRLWESERRAIRALDRQRRLARRLRRDGLAALADNAELRAWDGR